MSAPELMDLVGSTMESLQPVEDYYYLVLNRAYVCLFNPLLEPGTPEEWAQETVGSSVGHVELREEEYLCLSFTNGTRLTMSLRPEVFVYPEAATFMYRQHPRKCVVI